MEPGDSKVGVIILCGDVMTGRGIDQILPNPGKPRLYESYVRDARDYVALAELQHGTMPHPASFEYIWGDALREMQKPNVDLRIINLETSITCSNQHWPGKEVHYRMHPRNIDCLKVAKVDVCSLANNHMLDWGRAGLNETMDSLKSAGLTSAGAGRDLEEAQAPAVLDIHGKGRVVLFSLGSTDSGIPREWAAGPAECGLNVLDDFAESTARRLCEDLRGIKRPGDIGIASIHWGGNWGYTIPTEHTRFARWLIDGGFDVVYGHSSHHALPLEVYRGHLILYGCGDFINDYEGISGHEEFRGDLAPMYIARIDFRDGTLVALQIVSFQMKRFQLKHAGRTDADWLCARLNRFGARFGTTLQVDPDHRIKLSI